MKHKHNPWIYLVYNWDFIVGCYTSAAAAAAMVKTCSSSWEPPFPDGAVKVTRVRPASDLFCTETEDLTPVVLRLVYSMRKEAVVVR